MRPGRLEGVYAFRPRAHQDRVGTVLAAFGVAHRQSVNRDFLRVNQGAHVQRNRNRANSTDATTDAPSAANCLAMPAPIPFDAPVITATFPFSFPFFIFVPLTFQLFSCQLCLWTSQRR